MDIKRSYKFRFYPTPEQEQILARTFGCTRFIYNYMLQLRSDAWKTQQKSIGYNESSSLLTQLKRMPEYEWLNEVSCVPVQQSLRHLQTSFTNFFAKRSNYPQLKRKSYTQSATYTSTAFKWDGKTLRLSKMKDHLSIRWSRTIPRAAKVTTVTVSKDASGRYFVSMLCTDTVASKPKVEANIGIDLGLTHFATFSTGEKVEAPKALRNNEAKLVKLQRRLSKKQKGSKNRNKARLKVAKLHARIADTRRDFLHKLSTKLVNENQVIAIETLSVKNMLKNHNLAKSISDAGWSEFVRQLKYKASWYGRTIVSIDRWYPSSKKCSDCGSVIKKLPLSVREWICPECGVIHDRDVNAANNILTAGLAGLVCGENVIPVSLS